MTFHCNRLMGFGMARGTIMGFPKDLHHHPYSTLALPRKCDRTNEINELEMTQQIETMTVKLENVHNFYVQSSCSAPCTVKHLSTLWNCANQSQVSHHGNIFDPPPNSSWSYRATSSAPMVDGFSVWLIRRSGIPCRTACGIRLLAGTVSDNLWRRFCSQRTDAFSALEVSRRCAI